MTTSEDRMRVLRMLQQGDIDPETAAQMLHAVEQPRPVAAPPVPAAVPPTPIDVPASDAAQLSPAALDVVRTEGTIAAQPRWLRVRVTNADTGRPRVNVRLPFGMVRMGLKIGARYAPELEGIDLQELFEAVKTLEPGPFVDVYDDQDGDHVEVFIE